MRPFPADGTVAKRDSAAAMKLKRFAPLLGATEERCVSGNSHAPSIGYAQIYLGEP